MESRIGQRRNLIAPGKRGFGETMEQYDSRFVRATGLLSEQPQRLWFQSVTL
jgi:hypothetical protein